MKNKPFLIGDFVKERSLRLKKRIGQITAIRDDKNTTLECIQVHHRNLEPIQDYIGQAKSFTLRSKNAKHYAPKHLLFRKKPFDISSYIQYKEKGKYKFGRIVGYLHQEEGLYPHSYDVRKHNGKDLLECIEIKPVGLSRVKNAHGCPNFFVADSSKSKVLGVVYDEEDGKIKLEGFNS